MMSSVEVLFVHPNASGKIYQSLSKDFSAIEPPIWAALLANGIRAKNHSVAILDCEALRLSVEESAEKIKEHDPKLVAIVVYGQQPSASTQNMTGASMLCKELKNKYPDYKVIMIGLYPSALPAKTLQDEPTDFVCQGEGLYTVLGLLESGFKSENYDKIPGLWYRQNGTSKGTFSEKIPQTELQEYLPGMAWDLLPMDKYRTSNWHAFSNNNETSPFAAIYTSLGCPYKCSFCCINAPFGGSGFRYWNPEYMIGQFDKIAEMGIRNIKIADELFVLKKDHFMNLCKLIIERGHNFNIWAYARIDTVKEEFLETLKKAGVNWLALGIESGVTNVRKDVVKGKFEDVNIRDIVKKIHDHGINVIGNFIFGLPEDTIESMQETLNTSLELNCEMVNFYSCMAYPGSALYHTAAEEKWDLPDSYVGYSQHSYECKPLPTKHISAKEVLQFRDKAFITYFSNEKYLEYAKDKFGQGTVDNINNMLQHTLKRKLLGD
ncbi:MAG: cobalamin B12-binding domain-containing protein [Leptospiraceae bacterium]|nr:cobalamin B12-binding domain-containing protein [Leptospiraceae bacterium]